MKRKNMEAQSPNIAIVMFSSFPIGLAATNRYLAIAKGLVENGANVDVFIPVPVERPAKNATFGNKGIFQGVSFYYTSGKFTSKYKILRAISILTRFRRIWGYFTSCKEIFNKNKQCNYTDIIICSDTILTIYIYSRLARAINAKIINIFDEYPIPIRHKLKNKIPKRKEFFYKKVLRNVEGYLVISENLNRYFNRFCKKPTFVLPLIVDTSRFDIPQVKNESFFKNKYLCYMGNMELAKDDVDNIIKAFSLITEQFPSLKLFLFGNPTIKTKEFLVNLIGSLNLQNKVILHGLIASDKVPKILKGAQILVSSQPQTKRASGGFPTKLGEYLAAGVPVILTDVGENAKYVTNEKHLYFVEPENYKAYAEKLRFILENYESALKVAQEGKRFIHNNYSHKAWGKKLLNYIINMTCPDIGLHK